jgi:hypothetical protein
VADVGRFENQRGGEPSGRPGGRPLREGGDGSRVGGVSVEASRSGRPGGRPLRGGVPGGRCAWARSRRAPGAWRPFPAGCRDGPAPFLEAAELCSAGAVPFRVTWPTCEPLSGRPGGRPLREGGDGSRVGGVSVEASRSGRPGGRPLRGGVPGGRCAGARSWRAPGAWRPFPAGCRDGPAPFLEAAELCLGRGGPVQVTWPTCEPLSGRPGGRPLREGGDGSRVGGVSVEASRSGRPGGRPLRGGVPGGRRAGARSWRAPGAWRPFPAGCRDGPAPFLEAAELCLGRGGPVQVTWPTCEPLSGRPGGRPLREGGDGSRVGGVSVEASRSGRPGGRPLRGGVPGGRRAGARSWRAPGAWRPFPAGCRDGPAPFLEAAELCLGRGGPVQVTWPTCEPLSGRPGGRPLRGACPSCDPSPTTLGDL